MTPKQKAQEKITALQIRILEHQQEFGFETVFDFIGEDLDDIKIELGEFHIHNSENKEKEACQHCGNELCDAQKFNNQCFSCGKQPK